MLRLNDVDVRSNPTVWSHDPSMMWDPVTKKYYSYSTVVYRPECGLTEKIGIPVRSSKDLVHFTYEGTVLSEHAVAEGRDNGAYPPTINFWAPYVEYVHGEYRMYYSATFTYEGTVLSEHAVAEGRDNGAYPPTINFWAPYVEYVHGEYRMYYSATKAFGSSELSEHAVAEGRDNGAYPPTINFWAPYVEYVHGEYRMYYSATKAFGSSESRIWLAVAKNPLGPFENRGVAADTWGTDDTYPNAIDAHIIWDKEQCYLVYGSFFGGIYIKELEPSTGLPLDGNPQNLGICISKRGKDFPKDGPEGASIIFVPETGWFYLFGDLYIQKRKRLSEGWTGRSIDYLCSRDRLVLSVSILWLAGR